jgi:hypothetical protein
LGEIQGILHPSRSQSKREIDIPRSVNRAVDVPINAGLSSLCTTGRAHCFQRAHEGSAAIDDAAVSNRRAHESHAR